MARLADDLRPTDADNLPRPVAQTLQLSVDWNDGRRSEWQVSTAHTATAFGGQRPWYLCPRCGRRCRKLYPDVTLHALGCRVCLRLRYFSQRNLAYHVRLMARMERLIRDTHGLGPRSHSLGPSSAR